MKYLKQFFERIEKGQSPEPFLSINDILEILEEEGVGMGKNPYRTFVYYQEKGLIPKPKHRTSKSEAIFSNKVPFLIKSIREALQAGSSLSEIEVGLELSHQGRDDVIKEMLDIDANCKKVLWTGSLGGIRCYTQFYLCVLCTNALKIIKVESKNPSNYFTIKDDIHAEVVKIFTLEEYGETIKETVIQKAKTGEEFSDLHSVLYGLYPPLREPAPTLYDKYGPSYLEQVKGGFVRKRTPRKKG